MKKTKVSWMLLATALTIISCSKEAPKQTEMATSTVESELTVTKFPDTAKCVKIALDLNFQNLRMQIQPVLDAVATNAYNGVSMDEFNSAKFITVANLSKAVNKMGFANYSAYLMWVAKTQSYLNALHIKYGDFGVKTMQDAFTLTTTASFNPTTCVLGYQKCNIQAGIDYNNSIYTCGAAAFGTMIFNPLLGFGVYVVCGGFAIGGLHGSQHICAIDYKICMVPKLYISPYLNLVFVRKDLIYHVIGL